MNSKEQKLIIDNLLSSGVVYSRCAGIISGEYFDPEYRNAVQYIKDYAEKYGAQPTFDSINAKFDLGFKPRKLTNSEQQSSCDDIELFCKQKALSLAVLASIDDIESGNFGAMQERINKASLISLSKDMGVEMFHDPEAYLLSLVDNDIYYSTGIKALDDQLDGGLARKQLTLFSANSGGGKSVMLSNLGANFAMLHGMNVVYISLELAEPMIYKRNAFIMTGAESKQWKEKIGMMASRLNAIKAEGAGSYRVKRLPTGACINDVRSYLKQYELEYGYSPDVIIIDYLDLLSPNEGTKNMSISEQDKFKSEQYAQLLHDYNAIGISASQQNREAIKMSAPDQSVIAGGMTKVNTVDNFVSLLMTPEMRVKGEIMGFFLKTRSSDGVGKMVMMGFQSSCLRIGDLETGGMGSMMDKMKARKKATDLDKALGAQLAEPVDGLPGITPSVTPTAKLDKTLDKLEKDVTVTKAGKKRDNVADVSNLTKTKGKPKQSALDLLDEEEKVTQYGKGPVEQLPDNTGKELPAEYEEFINKHDLGKQGREFVMNFME